MFRQRAGLGNGWKAQMPGVRAVAAGSHPGGKSGVRLETDVHTTRRKLVQK